MPTYRSASGSSAEDLFIELFSDAFGAEKAGYLYSQYPFSDTNDMASATQCASDNSDVIYGPTANTVANNTGVVDNTCRGAGVPVLAGD